MENKLFYPAVFEEDENSFTITFPDLPDAISQGDNWEHAYEMAVEVLGLSIISREEEGIELPKASKVGEIQTEPGQTLVVVEFDMLAYKKKYSSRSVKKTLTLPEWINEEAIAAGINFSKVLQEALMLKLNLNR